MLKLKTTRFRHSHPRRPVAKPDRAARPAVRGGACAVAARGDRHGVPPDRHRRQSAAAARRGGSRRSGRCRDPAPGRGAGGDRCVAAPVRPGGDRSGEGMDAAAFPQPRGSSARGQAPPDKRRGSSSAAVSSAFGRSRGDRDFAGLRLVAGAGGTDLGLLGRVA